MSKFDSRKQSNPSTPTVLCLDDSAAPRKPHFIIRKIYHNARWMVCSMVSRGKAGAVYSINPKEIVFGQLPSSQFPKRARCFVRAGDWDTEVIAIEDHSVYKSMVDHFVKSRPWEDTPHYQEAVDGIRTRVGFRGVTSLEGILSIFEKWDELYHDINQSGLMSMREMLKRGIIDNPCKRLDEISVNLSREGSPLLNDGWHRFCIARILNIPLVPVRILARHRLYKQWNPQVPSP